MVVDGVVGAAFSSNATRLRGGGDSGGFTGDVLIVDDAELV